MASDIFDNWILDKSARDRQTSRQKGMMMSSQYRELMLLSGNVQARDRISATLNGQGNLAVLNRQGKVHFVRKRNSLSVRAARERGLLQIQIRESIQG